MLIGGGIMAKRQRARLQQISEGLRPAASRRVLIQNIDRGAWCEYVNGEAVFRTDAEAAEAEAAGARLIVIEYTDGDDWRER